MKHVSTNDISDFLDGTLSVARMRETAQHFIECDPCNVEYEAWKKTRAMLRRAPKSVSPGPDFWAATAARLAVEDRLPVQAPVKSYEPSWHSLQLPVIGFKTARRASAYLASAAALFGIIFFVGHISPVQSGGNSLPSAVDSINNDDVSSFVRAHTEAAAAQPLADGSRQFMLATDLDPSSAASSGDTTTDADTNL